MKKLLVILALALMLVPAVVMAQPGVTVPSYCTWNGDPGLRFGFDGIAGPGWNYHNVFPGATHTNTVTRVNAAASYVGCNAANEIPDTFCMVASSRRGWVLTSPATGTQFDPFDLPSGYTWGWTINIKASCTIGEIDTIIVRMVYARGSGDLEDYICAPECGDCVDPNIRGGVLKLYNADTLVLTVVTPPPALDVLQDSITYVEKGVNPAFIPFTICNQDACAPPTLYGYNIHSPYGVHIPAIDKTGTVTVDGGGCMDVYAELDATNAVYCDYDTLKIIVWTTSGTVVYDTCVQLVHIINPLAVPLFTVPVVTILVLALILAAAVFMRRRAVSRA